MPDAKILVVDDERDQCAMLERILKLEGYQVASATSGQEAVAALEAKPFDVVLSDLRMPDLSGVQVFEQARARSPEIVFIILTAYGTVESAVEAMKGGIYDYIEKPINADKLVRVIQHALETQRLKRENVALRQQITATREYEKIVGSSKAIRQALECVSTVAGTGATVLIQGESGTGKELVANLIHASSPRASKPLIKLNCAAIPETLLEDELFGHEKGAYTGAIAQRKGRFELAHGGTLFLDEIAEMPPHLQAKILRVLQEREFERVGGTETLAVDVRLIASTNRDIEDLVRQGEFREDLYYRINVVPIRIPPLRDRPEDIFILATHFLKKFSERNNRAFKGISKDARRLLLEYPWPGNVRELENCIERAVVMGKGDEITPDDILLRDVVGKGGKGAIIERLLESRLSVDGLEKELIAEALKRAHWNQSKAAEMLGLTRRTLQYRMEKHQIVRPALKEGQEA